MQFKAKRRHEVAMATKALIQEENQSGVVAMATLKDKGRQRRNSSVGILVLAFKRGILVISCLFRTLAFLAYKFTIFYRSSILFSPTYLFFNLGSPYFPS